MNVMSSSPEILTIGRNASAYGVEIESQNNPATIQINNLTKRREYQQKGENSVPSVEPAIPSEKDSKEDFEAVQIPG